jgi:two-component system sensor histidine kinase YesM
MAGVMAGVREIGGGRAGRLRAAGKKEFDALISDINDMLDRTEQYNKELIQERQKLFDAELSRQKMRIGLLASQMDAHFVVNTLQSIKRLADRGDTEKSGRMADGLAAILRHQHAGDTLVNIFEDFQVLERYVDIMNIKHDGKFTVEYTVDDELEAYMMPGSVLQPIVENALTHGLGGKAADARLTVRGGIRDGRVVFEVEDDGCGIQPDTLADIRDALARAGGGFPQPGLKGVALVNVQQRIRIRCGEGYGLRLDSAPGEGTRVTVTLPMVREKERD